MSLYWESDNKEETQWEESDVYHNDTTVNSQTKEFV